MGLTIHYSFQAQGSEAQARELMHALHQTAQDLPFKELGQIVELSGAQCDASSRPRNDSLGWLLVQATESIEFKPEGRKRNPSYTTWYNVPPARLIAFDTWPGEGCEAANFGLCQYPAVIQTDRGPLKTGLADWHWSSFCKTQYASDPKLGGVPNFLRCHLTVIAMLDRAKALGCLGEVSDEGGFWARRNVPKLVEEVGSWNELMAAFGGTLKDLLGSGPLGIQAAIAAYPNFEQLEAAGQTNLPPEYKHLVKLISRVGASLWQTDQQPGAEAGRESAPSNASS